MVETEELLGRLWKQLKKFSFSKPFLWALKLAMVVYAERNHLRFDLAIFEPFQRKVHFLFPV